MHRNKPARSNVGVSLVESSTLAKEWRGGRERRAARALLNNTNQLQLTPSATSHSPLPSLNRPTNTCTSCYHPPTPATTVTPRDVFENSGLKGRQRETRSLGSGREIKKKKKGKKVVKHTATTAGRKAMRRNTPPPTHGNKKSGKGGAAKGEPHRHQHGEIKKTKTKSATPPSRHAGAHGRRG